ncbi:MAG: 2OG-Fe(II) oxygenase [Azonexaceae bacterium]|nr:2OG-Fe(II) oxygenase [Azonexaceae bacterium]
MNLSLIADQLERVGYIVLRAPLLERLSAQLLLRCQDDDPERFHAARVGRGQAERRIDAIRGDVICWLDGQDCVDQAYLAWMEELRVGLNAALFLGLFDYECHYAIYGSGAGYARHLDVLAGTRNRVLSTVYYLNEAWQAADGGELLLFAPTGDAVIATVKPQFGTMIIFLSESFPHQVLAAHQSRRSIAGWFRVREIG